MKRWGFSIALICGVLLACCTAQAQLEDLWKKAQNYNAIQQPARNGAEQ